MSDPVEDLIRKFVVELKQLVRADIVTSLLAGEGVSAASAGKPQIVRAPGKRTPEQIEEQGKAIIAWVRKNQNSSAQQIADALNLSMTELSLPLSRLRETKSIRTTGKLRGTKYNVR